VIRARLASYDRVRLSYDVQPPFGLVSDWVGEFLRKGMVDDAIEPSRINVKNFPANAWAHSHLADAYLRKGDRAAAVASYKKAVTSLLFSPCRPKMSVVDRLAPPGPAVHRLVYPTGPA
jgi:hypothetical protein